MPAEGDIHEPMRGQVCKKAPRASLRLQPVSADICLCCRIHAGGSTTHMVLGTQRAERAPDSPCLLQRPSGLWRLHREQWEQMSGKDSRGHLSRWAVPEGATGSTELDERQ